MRVTLTEIDAPLSNGYLGNTSSRLKTGLRLLGCKTIRDVWLVKKRDFLRTKYVSDTSWDELITVMTYLGLWQKDEDENIIRVPLPLANVPFRVKLECPVCHYPLLLTHSEEQDSKP